jgi:hypothetical protein
MPLTRPLLALAAALFVLAGCGGMVASDAPALLTVDEIASRTADTRDQTRGAQEASALAWRAQRLRENAARLRRTGLSDVERQRLMRRAEDLKRH